MNTKEKILNRSLDYFNREGYNNVGVRDLARHLDISPGNLSYHFHKKENLLFALIEQFSLSNTSHFDWYYGQKPSLDNFLVMMKNILHTQYAYRGIIIGNHFVEQELRTTDRMNYALTQQKRRSDIRKIFSGLISTGFVIKRNESLDFVEAWMSLFGRFALQEAFLLHKYRDEKEVVNYYLTMLVRLLTYLSTDKGKNSIRKFRKKHLG